MPACSKGIRSRSSGTAGSDVYNGGLGSSVNLWYGVYAFWCAHPLLGIGPGSFELQIGRLEPGVKTHANGMYFQVLAEQGVVGLTAMFLVVAASVGAFLKRLDRPLALGALGAGIAMAFHQVVDCMWVYPKVAVLWWVILALGAASRPVR